MNVVGYTAEVENKTQEKVIRIAGDLLDKAVVSARRIGGSGNNRVYFLQCSDSRRYVAKCYFRNPADKRDRLAVEFNSLSFLSSQGLRAVPRPVAIGPEESCAIYEFVEGQRIMVADIRPEDVRHALDFVVDLKRLNKAAFSENIPPASDACFSIQAIIASVEGRLSRFAGLDNDGPEYGQLASFLEKEFKPFLSVLAKWAYEQCAVSGIPFGGEIPLEQKTLSPSDFGFHNALRGLDGRIVFLDFEYFGWDDPAKMVVDFLFHPAMGLSESMKATFVSGMLDIFKKNSWLPERVKLVYPLFGMKWCTIFLNEFVPNDFSRRVFAAAGPLDRSRVRREQLLKAKNLYRKIKETYLNFPYAA